MPSVFLYSDPHFGHQGVCKFMRNDGVTKLRPWDTAEEMDEELVRRFNETVGPNDKVYMLGDIAFKRSHIRILERLNCKDLVLIKGNHDVEDLKLYSQYFRDIRAYHIMDNYLLSHIPIHPESLSRWKGNWHGHTHANRVMKARGVDARTGEILYSDEIDPRYWCACVEQTDFAPILFEDALKRITEQGGSVGFKSGNGPTM
jgi:calcineurin-like phosphoesterase family protein